MYNINTNKSILALSLASIFSLVSSPVLANDYQDMSDPMAVYSQTGLGITDKGINFKFGQSYDTNNDDTMAMHVLEAKGFAADTLSLKGDDSFDSLRYRHFNVDITNGLGTQVDLNWDFDAKVGSASYSLIQALPEMGRVQLYPLAGLGLNVADVHSTELADGGSIGYAIPSSFALAGIYSKIEVTDNIWLNYNPMFTTQLGGAEAFKDLYGWQHEVAASYQLNTQSNIRAFWNFGEALNGTDFRVEYNYQF
ncbi:conserved exported hypothetical protein [Vibrio chagasii]|uniref:hypothetical protein n=1 Tax=Vibrio chagasii TaxID=170679 RepID=UPI00337D96C7|nr:conserved exported hypothetical protein [Vibrio chagasii]CAH6935695.1 conserved exported hypothetical protein [Vibrio chagasii]CAH7051756.1 conserved exported hypothetical protein [Vibrio chagasii]CAH7063505.1 conserved exported hypothetical protein [Vibrio chagasii]CAH7133042.1 conserved exported hypothetical protein [Vibrio chagasii]